MIKHIQELAKTSHGFVDFKRFTLVSGVGNDLSIADCISGCRKAKNIGQKLAEKEPLGLKYITANLFPHNCTLPENYMCLSAPHENKYPFWLLIWKIGTDA